jgi:hypothetical protein
VRIIKLPFGLWNVAYLMCDVENVVNVAMSTRQYIKRGSDRTLTHRDKRHFRTDAEASDCELNCGICRLKDTRFGGWV